MEIFCACGFILASEANPTLTSTIEIKIPACGDMYIYLYYVQNNVWHPTEGKCHVLRGCHNAVVPCSPTPYLKVAFG